MKTKKIKNHFSLFLCIVWIAAAALGITACSGNTPDSSSQTDSSTFSDADLTILGEGNTVFSFLVIDKEGNEQSFEIHTDKTTVGEALLELALIDGEQGSFGLYVKTVNGITADYDTDGTYWAFYIDGEYAVSGVDTTTITEGSVYSFRVE